MMSTSGQIAVLIGVLVTPAALGYFVGLTIARDKISAGVLTDLASWGWGSVDKARDDITGRDITVTVTAQAELVDVAQDPFSTARIRRVPPKAERIRELLQIEDDDGPGSMSTVALELFNSVVEKNYDEVDDDRLVEYRSQDRQLRQIRLAYRVLSCANCLGFHVQNLAGIAAFVVAGGVFGWHVSALAAVPVIIIQHATRRHYVGRSPA